jgi:hypothetical protein
MGAGKARCMYKEIYTRAAIRASAEQVYPGLESLDGGIPNLASQRWERKPCVRERRILVPRVGPHRWLDSVPRWLDSGPRWLDSGGTIWCRRCALPEGVINWYACRPCISGCGGAGSHGVLPGQLMEGEELGANGVSSATLTVQSRSSLRLDPSGGLSGQGASGVRARSPTAAALGAPHVSQHRPYASRPRDPPVLPLSPSTRIGSLGGPGSSCLSSLALSSQ